MPPDEALIADTRPAPVQQTVNVGDSGIFAGLGKYKSIVAFGFAGIVGILFVYAFQLIVSQGWEQRAEDRQLFREAIKSMNDEQNRRTGEVKGAVDINTSVMRDLIAEFKAARQSGTIRHDASVPKAAPP